MKILNATEVSGDLVPLKMAHPRHIDTSPAPVVTDIPTNFGQALTQAISKVNNEQLTADQSVQRMVSGDPTIEMHEVLIAVRRAEQSLTFARTIKDQLVRAFTDLQTLR